MRSRTARCRSATSNRLPGRLGTYRQRDRDRRCDRRADGGRRHQRARGRGDAATRAARRPAPRAVNRSPIICADSRTTRSPGSGSGAVRNIRMARTTPSRRCAVGVGRPIAASAGSILAGKSFMLRAIIDNNWSCILNPFTGVVRRGNTAPPLYRRGPVVSQFEWRGSRWSGCRADWMNWSGRFWRRCRAGWSRSGGGGERGPDLHVHVRRRQPSYSGGPSERRSDGTGPVPTWTSRKTDDTALAAECGFGGTACCGNDSECQPWSSSGRRLRERAGPDRGRTGGVGVAYPISRKISNGVTP